MRVSSKEFVFVGGTGRSGTTILSKILASHPRCERLPFEFRLHTDPGGLKDLYLNLTHNWDSFRGSDSSLRFEKFYNKLIGFSRNSYHNVTLKSQSKEYYNDLLSEFYEELGVTGDKRLWIGNSPFLPKVLSLYMANIARNFYPNFYNTRALDESNFFLISEKFYKSLFEKEMSKQDYLVEHTPYNFVHFDFLNNVFPQGKFIHIKRHPYDIISSYLTQNWGSSQIDNNVIQIINLYRQWFLVKNRLENYIEIALEDFTTNSDLAIHKISNYLGIDAKEFDNSIFSNKESNIDRWKDQKDLFLSLKHLKELNEVTRSLGYETF